MNRSGEPSETRGGAAAPRADCLGEAAAARRPSRADPRTRDQEKVFKALEKEEDKARLLQKEVEYAKALEYEKNKLLGTLTTITENNSTIVTEAEGPPKRKGWAMEEEKAPMESSFQQSEQVDGSEVKQNGNQTGQHARMEIEEASAAEEINRAQEQPVVEEEMKAELEENIEARTELVNTLSEHPSGEPAPVSFGELEIEPFVDSRTNICDVPISLAISTSIRLILERQLSLTNQALLHILLENDNFMDILNYFKEYYSSYLCIFSLSVFLCKRGDKIDEFLDFLFKENGELNWSSLKDANVLFTDLSFPILPDGKSFKLAFELTRQITRIIPQNIASFQMLQYLALKMTAPPVVEAILSKEILDQFLEILTFLMKIRFLDVLLRRSWQTINHDVFLQRRSDRLAKMLHLNRHAIHSFLMKYQEYIYHFVVERAWTKLVKAIDAARDIYEVKDLIVKFLTGIKRRSFIATHSKTMSETLEKMILCVYEFTGLVNQVSALPTSMLESMECESKLSRLAEDFRGYHEYINMMINYSTNKELRLHAKLESCSLISTSSKAIRSAYMSCLPLLSSNR